MEMGLDDVSALMDGQEMLAGAVEFDMEMAMSQELTEQILEVRDGKIAKMNVTTDAMDVEVSGEVNAMGEGDSLDESVESPTVGRTVQLTIDEDGEVSRKDITEDADPLSDAELATVTHLSHFEQLSPSDKVEEGKEFEIAPEWKEMMEQAMSGMDTSGSRRRPPTRWKASWRARWTRWTSPRPARSPRSRTASPPSSTRWTWT